MEADSLELPLAGEPPVAVTGLPALDAGEHLLARARTGQISGFRELVRCHQGAVYSLALRLLGSREDAQELAQDIFVLLHRHLGGITSPLHLRFWLRRAVCHRAIDRLRQRPRLAALSLEAAAQLEAPVQDSDPLLEQRLRQLMAQLPPVPRAVLLLRYQEDFDPTEIARALKLPLNTVKSHLRRSLALLRSQCGDLRQAENGEEHR